MQDKLESDLKAALLAGDKQKSEALKVLKSTLQYEALNLGTKESLNDEQLQKVLAREAKKRQEAADLYAKNGAQEMANKELAEKAIIEAYLPESVPEEKIADVVNEEVAKLKEPGINQMGQVIGAVRAKLGAGVDGGLVAKYAREALEKK